jgi:hypothetical protein
MLAGRSKQQTYSARRFHLGQRDGVEPSELLIGPARPTRSTTFCVRYWQREPDSDPKQSWKHYSGYTETEHLSVPLSSSVILPKRAFEAGELAAFGDLLRRKLSETH